LAEVQLDKGGGGVVPTITFSDADADADATTEKAPGALPASAAGAIPDWYTVGWRQMARIDEPELPEGEERDKSVLDMFVSEQYYGAWYHNAAIIVFVSGTAGNPVVHCLTRVLGRIRLSLPHAFRFWLGMAFRPARGLQYLLQHIHDSRQTACPR
jgi:hypothetical protein